jgi:hypothetical protein
VDGAVGANGLTDVLETATDSGLVLVAPVNSDASGAVDVRSLYITITDT